MKQFYRQKLGPPFRVASDWYRHRQCALGGGSEGQRVKKGGGESAHIAQSQVQHLPITTPLLGAIEVKNLFPKLARAECDSHPSPAMLISHSFTQPVP